MVNAKSSRFDSNAARAGLSALRSLQHRFARRSLMRKTESAINAHLPSLMKLRLERVTLDANGRVAAQAWADEVIYFIRSQIQPSLSARERRVLKVEQDRVAWMIADRVEAIARTSHVFYRFADQNRA